MIFLTGVVLVAIGDILFEKTKHDTFGAGIALLGLACICTSIGILVWRYLP